MVQVREFMGDVLVYISFDIDVIDLGYVFGIGQYLQFINKGFNVSVEK